MNLLMLFVDEVAEANVVPNDIGPDQDSKDADVDIGPNGECTENEIQLNHFMGICTIRVNGNPDGSAARGRSLIQILMMYSPPFRPD